MSNEDFERLARAKRTSPARELVTYLAERKKWWLLPLLVALGVVGLFVMVTASGAGPFVYALF